MKTKYILMALAATAAVLAGCKKDPAQDNPSKDPVAEELAVPSLSASVSTVTLEEASAASAALKLDWTAASQTREVSYDLYVNLSSRDLFTNPVKVAAGKALTYTFTHGELNDALTKLGAEGATEIQFGIYAISGEDSQRSNIVKVTVTPYAAAFVNPAAIYVIGTATPYAWDLGKALEIKPSSEGVYKASGLPLRVLPVANNQSIKFAFARNAEDDDRFAGQKPGAAFGEIEVVHTGMGYEFFPATAGYDNGTYDITVDFNTMKFSLVRTGDLPEEALPDKLYMMGDCMDWKWIFEDVKTTLDKVSGNTYEAKGINLQFGDDKSCGFKIFIGIDVYSPYFAMTDDSALGKVKVQKVETTDVPQFYPGKLGYADGVYDISIDFDKMEASLVRIGDIPGGGTPGDDNPSVLYLVGSPFGEHGWEFSDTRVMTKVSDGVYEIDSIYMDLEGDGYGFRIYPIKNDWGTCYMYKDGGYTSNTVNLTYYDEGGDPPQIFLKPMGFSTGEYSLSFNTNNCVLTLTAK